MAHHNYKLFRFSKICIFLFQSCQLVQSCRFRQAFEESFDQWEVEWVIHLENSSLYFLVGNLQWTQGYGCNNGCVIEFKNETICICWEIQPKKILHRFCEVFGSKTFNSFPFFTNFFSKSVESLVFSEKKWMF